MPKTKSEAEAFEKAISKYGQRNQLIVLIEELSELQKEICKFLRPSAKPGKRKRYIAEEMADVLIMIDQAKDILGITDDDIEMWRLEKVVRLRENLGLTDKFRSNYSVDENR